MDHRVNGLVARRGYLEPICSKGSKRNEVSLGKENQPPFGRGGLSLPTPPQSMIYRPSGSQSRGHTNRPSGQIAAGGYYSVTNYPEREPPSSSFSSPAGNDDGEDGEDSDYGGINNG